MLHRPNVMFISRCAATDPREDGTGRFPRAVLLMHFVFVQEEDGTYTVYKNSYDGKEYKDWCLEDCLDLVDMCYKARLQELNEEDNKKTSALP